MKRYFYLLAILSAILFGAASPLSKPLMNVFSTFQMAGLLYLGAAVGVSGILIKEKKFLLPWKMVGKSRIYLIGTIIFGGVFGPLFLLAGLKLASAASVSMWLTLETVTTAVLGHILFKDYLTKNGWLAVAGTILAAVILAWGEGIAGVKAGLLIALATTCWGLDNHFTALIDEITPAQSTFWKGVVAGTVNLSIGLLLAPWAANGFQLAGSVLIGVFSYGFSIVLYILSAQNLGATRSQMFFSSAPFFGVFLAAVFLGEKITFAQLAGAVLLALVFLLLFKENHNHKHSHSKLLHEHTHSHDDGHHLHDHSGLPLKTRHTHLHEHKVIQHNHPHLPDLHHRHSHTELG
jgi:drug/metabolite transporter (DMT)-like permease